MTSLRASPVPFHRPIFSLLLAALLLGTCAAAGANPRGLVAGDPPYLERDDVREFIRTLAREDGFDTRELERLFAEARPQQRVLDLISTPAEGRPWKDYRPIFLTEQRIRAGERFWQEHEATILRAQEAFQVNAEIIVAIIGVETFYGRHQGTFPVLDALVTLGFDYPPRANFFRSELRHYLHLVREEGLDLRGTLGSYAGAMGRGQFISSSYREYAVDFSGDGRRDLLNSWPDAIGSVANYFRRHHWTMGAPVVVRARVEGDAYKSLVGGGYQARYGLDELARHGIVPEGRVAPDARFSVIELQAEEGTQVWLGYENFYVITRYNRSPLYAMAVYELAREIRKVREQALAEGGAR
ncbi:lytic murein transglycosylase B [Ectothiorhodospira sp. PHS-1]|uniref:lytic murein transglycosylase B n=1 Tax=Ectothiorhodospira sp. PHS-1 TaxID=519989 RepID=UPI0006829B0E|nr:lytic murein transglycosylase B [Ectothiorhodospira sp. PHS-1]